MDNKLLHCTIHHCCPLANKVENTDCGQLPPKCSFPWGTPSLHLIHGCLGPPKSKKPQTASRSVQPFCSAHAFDQQTHPFNSPFSGTTRVGRYQKGKTNQDFTEARDSEWHCHQLHLAPDRQPDQHPTTQFFTGWMPFLPPNQQCQSTEGKDTQTDHTTYVATCYASWCGLKILERQSGLGSECTSCYAMPYKISAEV